MISFSFRKWLEAIAIPPPAGGRKIDMSAIGKPEKAPTDMDVPPPGEENYWQMFLPTDPHGAHHTKKSNVGTEGNPMGRIDAFIDNMVDSWKNFTATPERISPSHGGGSNLGDLGAALAGRKVAWFTGLKGGDLSSLIISRIKQRIGNEDPKFARGVSITYPFQGQAGTLKNHVLIGPEEKLRKLVPLLRRQAEYMDKDLQPPPQIEREVGILLGYPPESVRAYLKGSTDISRRLDVDAPLSNVRDMEDLARDFGRGLGNAPQFPSPEEVEGMSLPQLRRRMRGTN